MSLVDFIAPGNPRARMSLDRQALQVLMATLNRRYSNAVADLEVERVMLEDRTYITIKFKNGYRVRYPSDEVNGLECQGMCVMVYDLPPKEADRGRDT